MTRPSSAQEPTSMLCAILHYDFQTAPDKSVHTLPQLHACTSVAVALLKSLCLDYLSGVLQTRLGNPAIGVGLVGIILVAVFNSTVLAVAVNAR